MRDGGALVDRALEVPFARRHASGCSCHVITLKEHDRNLSKLKLMRDDDLGWQRKQCNKRRVKRLVLEGDHGVGVYGYDNGESMSAQENVQASKRGGGERRMKTEREEET